MTDVIIEKAAAKVNLNLHILNKRADGYHTISSLFVFTEFSDILSFYPSEGRILEVEGEFADSLNGISKNSVEVAAEKLAYNLQIPCCYKIRLEKRIPVAAGIGGGTADAAAALRGLMRLWRRKLPEESLRELLLELGADVPACFMSRAVVAEGVGEKLNRTLQLPKGIPVLLVNPREKVITKDVFKVYDESDVGRDVGSFLFKDEYDSVADLVADLKNTENSLKKAAERVCPEITEVIKAIEEKNSLFTTMSGSGATCFGLFPNRFLLSEAAGEIRRRYPKWWVCETEIV